MTKLTQQEATALIEQAWKMVVDHNLGSYRFGETLWHLLPKQVWYVENSQDILLYEPNSDIVVEKFYRHFVEGGN